MLLIEVEPSSSPPPTSAMKTGLPAPDSLMETLMPAEHPVRVRGMLRCPLDRPAEIINTSVSPPSSPLNHSISYSWNNSSLIAISCCKLNNCTFIEFKRLSSVEGAQRNFHSPLQKQNEQKVGKARTGCSMAWSLLLVPWDDYIWAEPADITDVPQRDDQRECLCKIAGR